MPWPWPWFIPYPTGHIGPHSDAIHVCQELPPLLPPRWTPSFVGFCWLCPSSSLLVDLVLFCILVRYLPVQCLLWYALVVHTEDMSKPANSSFSQYVVHGLLSSSGSDLHISYPVFPWDAQWSVICHLWCAAILAIAYYYYSVHFESLWLQWLWNSSKQFNDIFIVNILIQTCRHLHVIDVYNILHKAMNSEVLSARTVSI